MNSSCLAHAEEYDGVDQDHQNQNDLVIPGVIDILGKMINISDTQEKRAYDSCKNSNQQSDRALGHDFIHI